MLVGNYSILNKTPGRWLGGNSTAHASGVGQSVVVNRSNWGTTGASHNMALPDAGEANELWSLPNGYGGDSWIMPITAGYLSSHNIIIGAGSLSGTGALGKNASTSIVGIGTFTTTGQLIVSATATLSGQGTFSPVGVGTLAASSAITGGSDVSSVLSAEASIIVSMEGVGDIDATIRATGTLASEINVTGDVLTTATVGSSVWGEALEAGFTADRILRIIAAAVAGEVTGGPDAPVFRNVSDTNDLISGDADTDGNRSNITYGD